MLSEKYSGNHCNDHIEQYKQRQIIHWIHEIDGHVINNESDRAPDEHIPPPFPYGKKTNSTQRVKTENYNIRNVKPVDYALWPEQGQPVEECALNENYKRRKKISDHYDIYYQWPSEHSILPLTYRKGFGYPSMNQNSVLFPYPLTSGHIQKFTYDFTIEQEVYFSYIVFTSLVYSVFLKIMVECVIIIRVEK
jgi:hypothetical protein